MKTSDLLSILLLVIGIVLMSIIVVMMFRDGTKCSLNPLIFGASKLEKDNNAQVFCQCNILKENSINIFFNSKNMTVGNQFADALDRKTNFPNFPNLTVGN